MTGRHLPVCLRLPPLRQGGQGSISRSHSAAAGPLIASRIDRDVGDPSHLVPSSGPGPPDRGGSAPAQLAAIARFDPLDCGALSRDCWSELPGHERGASPARRLQTRVVWWIKYYVDGRPARDLTMKEAARKLLKQMSCEKLFQPYSLSVDAMVMCWRLASSSLPWLDDPTSGTLESVLVNRTARCDSEEALVIGDIDVVDAHHHLWDLRGPLRYPWLTDEPHEFFLGDYQAICRNYLPDDYRRDAQQQRVVRTVHVEAECDRSMQVAETRWLTDMHARYGMPNAIVAHASFDREDTEAILAAHAAFPLVRGIRSKPRTTTGPDKRLASGTPGTMTDPRWLAGFALLDKHGLTYDLRVPPWHLEEAADVARGFPRTPMVLNHTGFPWDRSVEGLRSWWRGMEALAGCPNVHVKTRS